MENHRCQPCSKPQGIKHNSYRDYKLFNVTQVRVVTVLVCFLFVIKSNGQVLLKNLLLSKPDSNVLFLGWENRIQLYSPNGQKATLVSQNGSSVYESGQNQFVVFPKSLHPDILKVFINKKIASSKKYILDTISIFSTQLGNLRTDTASVNEILANKGLRYFNNNRLFNYPYSVVTFWITTIDARGDTLTRKTPTDGNILSTEQQSNIRLLTKNCTLIFDHIIITAPGMKNRQVDPLKFVIR